MKAPKQLQSPQSKTTEASSQPSGNVQRRVDDSSRQVVQHERITQLQAKDDPNGLPQPLRSGIEALSGFDMGGVRVHRNSSRPAQLQAHAYAQGSDIHLGPGQEKHLAHEAWHVVQQKQGRVKPTMQMKDRVSVNDDTGLEREADVMGARAAGDPVQLAGDRKRQGLFSGTPVVQAQTTVQLYEWGKSTPLSTIGSFFASPSWEGAKDLYDPRRWRLNPLNLLGGRQNSAMETAGGNYHTSSRHGAHNTVGNASARLSGTMDDHYTGGVVAPAANQGRFNSEAWESFSWRKAKELFEADIGVPVTWVAGPFPANARSSWNVCLNHAGSDVGISMSTAAPQAASVSGVRVAVNYRPMGAGVEAYNGQMYPTAPVAPPAGTVRIGDPWGAMNGTLQAVPYERWSY